MPKLTKKPCRCCKRTGNPRKRKWTRLGTVFKGFFRNHHRRRAGERLSRPSVTNGRNSVTIVRHPVTNNRNVRTGLGHEPSTYGMRSHLLGCHRQYCEPPAPLAVDVCNVQYDMKGFHERYDPPGDSSVPNNQGKPLRRLINFEKKNKVNIGASLCTINGKLFVTDVFRSSIAWRIGLQIGDCIEEVNGTQVGSLGAKEIMNILFDSSDVELTVLQVPLFREADIQYPETELIVGKPVLIGINYMDGEITGITEGSIAYLSGLKKGDTIVAIDGEWVFNITDKEIIRQVSNNWKRHGFVSVIVAPKYLADAMWNAFREWPLQHSRRMENLEAAFGKAIQCLAKFGENLHIETYHDKLTMSTVSPSKSAYACFQMHADFFESFTPESQGRPDVPLLRCKLLLRTCLPILRPLIIGDRFVEKLGLKLCTSKLHFEVRLYCKFGIVKTYNLRLHDCDDLQAINYKDKCPNNIRCQILNECVVNFPSSLEEITMTVTDDFLSLKTYLDDDNGLSSKNLMTEFNIQRTEFTEFHSTGESVLTFCLKEMKAILAFCDARRQAVSMFYETGGRPITFSVIDNGVYEANFVLATLVDNTVTPSQPSQSTQQAPNSQPSQSTNHNDISSSLATTIAPSTSTNENIRKFSRGGPKSTSSNQNIPVTPSGRIETPKPSQRLNFSPASAFSPSARHTQHSAVVSSTHNNPYYKKHNTSSNIKANTIHNPPSGSLQPTTTPPPWIKVTNGKQFPTSTPGNDQRNASTINPLESPAINRPGFNSPTVLASNQSVHMPQALDNDSPGVTPSERPKRPHTPTYGDNENENDNGLLSGVVPRTPPREGQNGSRPLFRVSMRGRQPPRNSNDEDLLWDDSDDNDSQLPSPRY